MDSSNIPPMQIDDDSNSFNNNNINNNSNTMLGDSPLLSSRTRTQKVSPSYFPPDYSSDSPSYNDNILEYDNNKTSIGSYGFHIINQLWNDSDKQSLLIYLCLRLIYTIIALISSSYSSSVGLVCVAFYSLFECFGLAVELWAGAAERDRYDDSSLNKFSYGYQRLEVLSAFGNTVFLLFVSLFTLEHAIERIFEPPIVSSGTVTAVALVGCILNLIGLLITQNSRANESKKQLQGQVLWVRLVTDNLVSFGVTFSAFLSQNGFLAADPLIAGLISIAVIYTSIPLASKTKDILLLATPLHIKRDVYKCIGEVLSIEGVLECNQEHFWTVSNNIIVGSLHVIISDTANEQITLQKINNILRPYVQNLTVQIQRNNWDVHSTQLRDTDI